VTEILQDPELRGRMRQNALKRIQDFSEERFVDNTYALYREVLNGQ